MIACIRSYIGERTDCSIPRCRWLSRATADLRLYVVESLRTLERWSSWEVQGVYRAGRRGALRAVALSVALLVTAPAAAEPEEAQRFEVSPFIGYRVGGSFKLIDTGRHVELDDHGSFALALDARSDELTQYELFYGRQSTVLRGDAFTPATIDVEYLRLISRAVWGSRASARILPSVTKTRVSRYLSRLACACR